ncbi:MAG: methyl-accepting chemotaxis protein [Kiritimatiellia bacterium]
MKRTIGMKIGVVLGLALAALVIVGTQSYRTTNRLIADTGWVAHTQQVREEIASMFAGLHEAETYQRGYLLTGAAHYSEDSKAAAREVKDRLASLRQLTADNPKQQRRLDAVEPLIKERLDALLDGEKSRAEKGLEGAAQYAASGVGHNLMVKIRVIADEMNKEESTLLAKRTRESETSSSAALNTIRCGIPIAIVAVCIIGFVLTRNITRPLKAATTIADRMAAGDVSVEIAGENRGDEAGQLLHAFKRMTGFQRVMAGMAGRIAEGDLHIQVKPQSSQDLLGNAFAAMVTNLRSLTGEITEAVNVLGSASNEIVASTSQLAASATETATAVTETTTTVEEVKQTAQVSSQKAKSVSESAQKSAHISQAGRKSADEMIESMKRIHQQMSSIADSMVRLSEQTQAIGQIIAAVDDLAAQSNLLAVNAAIEAAKAGEQGKGFTVVAQEVKSLAEQSKQATAQVRTILNDIQKAAGAAVMATEQGTKAVEAGVKQSAQAGESIQALTDSVTESAQAATQIAASSQQQLIGVDQVASAMESIKQATAQNVAGAKQMETSARNLNDVGRKLKQLIERYKV